MVSILKILMDLFIAENGRAIENVKNKLFELRYARIEDELTEVPSGFKKFQKCF